MGAVVSAYCTGVGKVLLAWQSPTFIAEYITAETFLPVTRNTILEAQAFRTELAKTFQKSWVLWE